MGTTVCKQTEKEHALLPNEVLSIEPKQYIYIPHLLVSPLFCPPPVLALKSD
jgi:hypothetical protein